MNRRTLFTIIITAMIAISGCADTNASGKGKLSSDKGELSSDKGELSSDKGKLSSDKGELSSDKGELSSAETVKKLKSTQNEISTTQKKGRKAGTKTESTDGGTINLTKAEFLTKIFDYESNSEEWKYEGELPAIVDFYADWCQPCKIASPILDELAKEYKGKIYVYKIDTQKERELAAAFGIQSIPTFMLIPMEGKPQVFSGIGQTPEATKEIFKQAIDEVLLQRKRESK